MDFSRPLDERLEVLIVEHSGLAREVLEKSIETHRSISSRCNVSRAKSLEGAKDALMRRRPDIIITDLNLEREGDSRLLEELTKIKEAADYDPRLIVVTPMSDLSKQQPPTNLGLTVSGYIIREKIKKPYAEMQRAYVEGIKRDELEKLEDFVAAGPKFRRYLKDRRNLKNILNEDAEFREYVLDLTSYIPEKDCELRIFLDANRKYRVRIKGTNRDRASVDSETIKQDQKLREFLANDHGFRTLLEQEIAKLDSKATIPDTVPEFETALTEDTDLLDVASDLFKKILQADVYIREPIARGKYKKIAYQQDAIRERVRNSMTFRETLAHSRQFKDILDAYQGIPEFFTGIYNLNLFHKVFETSVTAAYAKRAKSRVTTITRATHDTSRTVGIIGGGVLSRATISLLLNVSDKDPQSGINIVVLPHTPASGKMLESRFEGDPRVRICPSLEPYNKIKGIKALLNSHDELKRSSARADLETLADERKRSKDIAMEKYFRNPPYVHVICSGSGINPSTLHTREVHYRLYESEMPVAEEIMDLLLPFQERGQEEEWNVPGGFGYMLWQTNPLEFVLSKALTKGFNQSLLFGQSYVDTLRAKRVIAETYNKAIDELRAGEGPSTRNETIASNQGKINESDVQIPSTLGPHGGEDMIIPFQEVYIRIGRRPYSFDNTIIGDKKEEIYKELRESWIEKVLLNHGYSIDLPSVATLEVVSALLSNRDKDVPMMGYADYKGHRLFTTRSFPIRGGIICPPEIEPGLIGEEEREYIKTLERHKRWQNHHQEFLDEMYRRANE